MDSKAMPVEGRRSLWRHRDFTLLWAAQTVSQIGSQITFFAIPVIALTVLDASTTQVGLLVAAETLPFLLVSLPAGVWVDRWDRRRTLIFTDVGRMVVLAALPLAFLFDLLSIPLMLVVGLLVGIQTVFFDIADQAYLPSVVDTEDIPAGNTRLEVSRSIAYLGGPSFGGLLLQVLLAPLVLLINVFSYLLSAVLISQIRHRPDPTPKPATRRNMAAEIGEGLRFVFGNRTLRAIAMCTGLMNLIGLGGALSALLVVFALNDLDLSAGTLGLILTLGNAGALLGAFVNAWVVRTLGLGATLIGAALLAVLPILLIASAGPGLGSLLISVAIGIQLAGISVYNINQISLRQAITPTELQGRMNASMRFAVWGTLPLGAAIGGALGDAFGVRPMLWALGFVAVLVCLPLLLTREIRTLRTGPAETA
ncbi:MFS transporter [Acrocarpospora phusangensis]|uniref:MFS transporter n=1 Tax=Acrocarpospora phusangensis TaxID=1070424 RepID=A0A919QF55_9ACTN|nr:MFS transporter [Acrocarpospora phusangensis]GIH27802.1 MFS transporter [Acrocarpospora phusangensis]